MGFHTWADIREQLDHVDDPDVLQHAKTNSALRLALMFARPENWWGLGVEPDTLLHIAQRDGIPLVWVPRKDLIADLAALPDGAARRRLLLKRADDVLDDVDAALDACTHDEVADTVALARRAAEAYRAGHHEAAMALAVSIGEPLAIWASIPRFKFFDTEQERAEFEEQRSKHRYKLAQRELGAMRDDFSTLQVMRAALIAPIPKFFTPWFPEGNQPVPTELSRHVVAHQPSTNHLSQSNALVSLLLVASILRDQQNWAEEVDAMDRDIEPL